MSVSLKVLHGDNDHCDLEVMAPDYGMERFWIWDEHAENRIDLSWEQMQELRRFLNEEIV